MLQAYGTPNLINFNTGGGGQDVSIIIFGGIIARLPAQLLQGLAGRGASRHARPLTSSYRSDEIQPAI
jgi:hypothetical protein